MSTLSKNSFYNIIYTLLNFVFPLISSVYVARVLSAEGIGQVVFAQSVASYFVTSATLGLPNHGLREIAQNRDNAEQINRLFTELLLVNTGSTTISLIVYIAVLCSVSQFYQDISLFTACGSVILLNYFNFDWFYQGREEYGYIVVRNIVVKVVALLMLFFFVHDKNDYIIYAWIVSFSTGGNYLLNVVRLRKCVKLCWSNIDTKKHLKPVIIIGASVVISSIYARIDTTMLGFFSTDVETGYYSYAHKTVEIFIMLGTAITTVFMPRLSNAYKNDMKQFYVILNHGIDIITFLAFPLAVGTYLLAPQIIEVLYGEAFSAAAVIVRVFAVLIIIKCFGNLLCYQLVLCTGNEKERLPATIVASLLNVGLNFCWIPMFGAVGAAIASVISEVAVNVYQIIKMRKVVHIEISLKKLFQAVIGSIVMGMTVYAVSILQLPVVTECVAAVTVGILVYVACNFMWKNELVTECVKRVNKSCRHRM